MHSSSFCENITIVVSLWFQISRRQSSRKSMFKFEYTFRDGNNGIFYSLNYHFERLSFEMISRTAVVRINSTPIPPMCHGVYCTAITPLTLVAHCLACPMGSLKFPQLGVFKIENPQKGDTFIESSCESPKRGTRRKCPVLGGLPEVSTVNLYASMNHKKRE